MKKRYTEEQIIGFLKQAAAGTPVKELCCWRALKTDPGCALNFDPPGVRG
ncbi:hypothetical protein XCY_002393 [Xanthomonas arboricola pv. juglandis]|nr:transposase [Xanthomonas arboricola]MDN0219716.1 hypothetical protein [Xanthomonas arboricola pv. juglandis]MDN0224281.1 hypothetical protein [Xanthomonas arboricola pv. juglandis]MDN0229083.1 hypothetical protein [Xanthomonas arboricola pv. juglandis]MDN0233383.1 hypothetical protein [Xanthomonas arboricola pv. juglandis]MDN0237300.1 hypothetical protein [Xanthomonas arboricola pv. juglandis]